MSAGRLRQLSRSARGESASIPDTEADVLASGISSSGAAGAEVVASSGGLSYLSVNSRSQGGTGNTNPGAAAMAGGCFKTL